MQDLSNDLFPEGKKLDSEKLTTGYHTTKFTITYKNKNFGDLRKEIARFRRCANLALDVDYTNLKEDRKQKYDNSSVPIKFSCTFVCGMALPIIYTFSSRNYLFVLSLSSLAFLFFGYFAVTS